MFPTSYRIIHIASLLSFRRLSQQKKLVEATSKLRGKAQSTSMSSTARPDGFDISADWFRRDKVEYVRIHDIGMHC